MLFLSDIISIIKNSCWQGFGNTWVITTFFFSL